MFLKRYTQLNQLLKKHWLLVLGIISFIVMIWAVLEAESVYTLIMGGLLTIYLISAWLSKVLIPDRGYAAVVDIVGNFILGSNALLFFILEYDDINMESRFIRIFLAIMFYANTILSVVNWRLAIQTERLRQERERLVRNIR